MNEAEECQYENIPTSCPCLYFSDTLTLCIMELPLYNANLLLRRFILSKDPLLYRYTIVYARLSAHDGLSLKSSIPQVPFGARALAMTLLYPVDVSHEALDGVRPNTI